VADQLLLIERELQLMGAWAATSPDAGALASCEPFCVDTLDFDQWLQWIFLPRMKSIIENGEALPAASGILVMAKMVYGERGDRAAGLLQALEHFDRLIGAAQQ
jgi:uncharacterized protein YqcC (DUF446 family)